MTQSDMNTISNEEQFRSELTQNVPYLRAFARVLCGRDDQANDLAQEAVGEAWDRRASFGTGIGLRAGLFKILRDNYYARRGLEWSASARKNDGGALIENEQLPDEVELKELAHALGTLSDEQREALILVGASGFAYKEAAAICDCAVGTIKSRVARARNALYQVIQELNEAGDAEQRIEDGNEVRFDGERLSAEHDSMPPAQISAGALYARRLMGASRRLLH
ncbi:MAG: RNA polymerase subunit sigma-70 [Alphaproteobacteria bacterium]|nr:RNA polymerase subunit sigma-70 [Alphaproteobacteria bacterium]